MAFLLVSHQNVMYIKEDNLLLCWAVIVLFHLVHVQGPLCLLYQFVLLPYYSALSCHKSLSL